MSQKYFGVRLDNIIDLFNFLYKKKITQVASINFISQCDHRTTLEYTHEEWELIKYCPFCFKSTIIQREPPKYKEYYKLRKCFNERESKNFPMYIENLADSDLFDIMKSVYTNGIWLYDIKRDAYRKLFIVSDDHPWFRIYDETVVELLEKNDCELQKYVEGVRFDDLVLQGTWEKYKTYSYVVNSGQKNFLKNLSIDTLDVIVHNCGEDITDDIQEMVKCASLAYTLEMINLETSKNLEMKSHKIRLIK